MMTPERVIKGEVHSKGGEGDVALGGVDTEVVVVVVVTA